MLISNNMSSSEKQADFFVHYGAQHFVPERFKSARNGNHLPKPLGGTGLWASRENDRNGWAAWCMDNQFKTDNLRSFFRFTFSGGSILTISSPKDLIALPKQHTWECQEETDEDIADFDLLNNEYIKSWCYLDFEKLSEKYDAIELINSKYFYNILYSWDCNCLLVLKADKIKEVSLAQLICSSE